VSRSTQFQPCADINQPYQCVRFSSPVRSGEPWPFSSPARQPVGLCANGCRPYRGRRERPRLSTSLFALTFFDNPSGLCVGRTKLVSGSRRSGMVQACGLVHPCDADPRLGTLCRAAVRRQPLRAVQLVRNRYAPHGATDRVCAFDASPLGLPKRNLGANVLDKTKGPAFPWCRMKKRSIQTSQRRRAGDGCAHSRPEVNCDLTKGWPQRLRCAGGRPGFPTLPWRRGASCYCSVAPCREAARFSNSARQAGSTIESRGR
jgi:hypothetical protein